MLRVWARLADIDLGAQINTGFSFKRVIFARLKEGDFGGVGWVWGAWASRVGWCGAVLRVWARLADFDLGVKLTLGFHLNGHGYGSTIGRQPGVFFMDRCLEGRPESRGPFWRVRAVYWWVTVGVGAPGKV